MNKKVPDIRFKEFDEEWAKTPLREVSFKVTDKNMSKEYRIVLTNSAELGVIDQKEYFERNIANDNSISGYYVVCPNDYVYNPRISTTAPVGPINRNKLEYIGVMSPLYYIFRIKGTDIDLQYLDYFFKSSIWHDFMYKNGNSGARSDRFSISDATFSLLPISHPISTLEQAKIGKLLTTIDKLIDKLEQKLQKLRNVKQALLNQMFTNVNRGGYEAPLLRFKNHNEEWQMEKLGNISERIVRKNTNMESSLPLTISAQYGLIDQGEFYNARIASKDVSGYYLIKQGEFAYNKSSSDGYPFGTIKRLDKYEKGVLSTLYIVFALDKDKVSSDYIVAFYDTVHWHKDVEKRAAEGARNHGLLNISSDDFFETLVALPKEKSEQQEIGNCFIFLDDIINAESNKLNKTRTIKQSLLQKMFA